MSGFFDPLRQALELMESRCTHHPTINELEREIATDYARTAIECNARMVMGDDNGPFYDVTQLEPGRYTDEGLRAADAADVARAVRYLELRGLLVRPVAGQPQLVGFKE